MADSTLATYSRDGHIATITYNRPEKLNAINAPMRTALNAAWNEFLAALIFMSNAEDFTIPVMLLNAQAGQFGTVNWGAIQAGLTISMLPCAVLFLLLQRYYINGLIAGAVKG